jgi:hypothetical protein
MIQHALKSDIVKWREFDYHIPPDDPETQENLKYAAVRLCNNLAQCSCPACGNPRRHAWWKGERLTMQERRANEDYKEQLCDLDLGEE